MGSSYLTFNPRRIQNPCDRIRQLLPARTFAQQLCLTRPRQTVELGALFLLRKLPLRRDPPLPLQAMRRWKQGASFNLQGVTRSTPYALNNAIAVLWSPLQPTGKATLRCWPSSTGCDVGSAGSSSELVVCSDSSCLATCRWTAMGFYRGESVERSNPSRKPSTRPCIRSCN